MNLHQRLAALQPLGTPMWVYDAAACRIPWANRNGLAFWRAATPEELYQRDFSNLSDAERTRQRVNQEATLKGEVLVQEMTLFPGGAAVRIRCILSAIHLDDGHPAVLCEAHPKDDVDPVQLRGVEALRHTSVIVALVTASGAVLMQNPASQRVFDVSETIDAWFTDPGVLQRLKQATAGGQTFRDEVEAETREGTRWCLMEARPTKDPATGKPAVLVQMLDVTARRERDEMIQQQRMEILALSAPILDVGQNSLVMPVIGELDSARSAQITETLLSSIVERRAQNVILDFTGASGISVPHLLALVRALTLLGARPILSGVRAPLARELVEEEATLEGVQILRNLHQAMAACAATPRARPPTRPPR
ncbi:STAS domain-containing protein [Chondromyces crocatus]|uniref:Anti-anti sigma factor protein n=1 Tax=Chondromyces crocatus TaxID=52 RepID=A0A0K1E9Y0_CHOCO|nr:anti-anti sigma factor protein [Chondromyces crocatus]